MVFIVFAMALSACGENDMFIAKTVNDNDKQLADIESRICRHDANDCYLPFHALNVAGETQVASVDLLPGEAAYAACGACHGAQGGGGIGPMLAGQSADYLTGRLVSYRNGETVGAKSGLMWGQAAGLSDQDISDLVDYVLTF